MYESIHLHTHQTPSQCHNCVLESFFTHPQGISLHCIPYTNLYFICTYQTQHKPNTIWGLGFSWWTVQRLQSSCMCHCAVQYIVTRVLEWATLWRLWKHVPFKCWYPKYDKNATVYPKVSCEGICVSSSKLTPSKPGQLWSVYPPVQAKTTSTTHLKLKRVNPSHSEQNGVKKNSPGTEINLIYWTPNTGFLLHIPEDKNSFQNVCISNISHARWGIMSNVVPV